jgi:hypothetical protein
MKMCIKIIFEVQNAQEILEKHISKLSEKYKVEGVGQQIKKDVIQLFICGQQAEIDHFVDSLYLEKFPHSLQNIMIETCPADRSYRGVFRIVE